MRDATNTPVIDASYATLPLVLRPHTAVAPMAVRIRREEAGATRYCRHGNSRHIRYGYGFTLR